MQLVDLPLVPVRLVRHRCHLHPGESGAYPRSPTRPGGAEPLYLPRVSTAREAGRLSSHPSRPGFHRRTPVRFQARRRAMDRKPVWPTIRWSGRTLRSVTCQPRRSDLERLDLVEPARQGQHELLDLHRRRQVAHRRRRPGSSTSRQRRQRPPRLGEVQHGPVVPLPRACDLVDRPRRSSSVRDLPEERLDVREGLLAMLVADLVGDDPAPSPDRAHERDRERARPRPGLQHPRARGRCRRT